MNTKNYYAPSEIAKMCEVSTGSVIRWIREGKLTSALTGGGHYRVRKEDLYQFLKTLHILPPSGDPKNGVKRILIVDDEKNIRSLIRSCIETNFSDVKIDEAGEGFIAGWKVRDFHPDLVVLDLNLPGLDGFRVCEFIRSLLDFNAVKIIAVTGMGGDSQQEILRRGANDFLAKPFDQNVLKEKIEQQLYSGQPHNEKRIDHDFSDEK